MGGGTLLEQCNYILKALGLLSVFIMAMRTRRLSSAIVIFIALIVLATYFFLRVGLRTEFFPVLVVYVTSIVLWRRDLLPTWKRTIAIGLAFLLAGAFLNGLLGVFAGRGGLYGQAAQVNMNRGAQYLQPYGLDNAPDIVLIAFGQAVEYALSPLQWFDFYYHYQLDTTARGGHQFDLIARRFGNTCGPIIKQEVDDLYLVIGVETNAWATAIREMMVDFGERGSLVAFAVIGTVMGICRRRQALISAKFLLAILFAYTLVSPFFSLLRSGFMECGLYLAIVLFVAELGLHSDVRAVHPIG